MIWLGDLNYRIALSYADTKKLLMENDWDALFEKDQVTFLSRQERACAVLGGSVGKGLLWVYIFFFSECKFEGSLSFRKKNSSEEWRQF